jgi:hypothetical protein
LLLQLIKLLMLKRALKTFRCKLMMLTLTWMLLKLPSLGCLVGHLLLLQLLKWVMLKLLLKMWRLKLMRAA